MYKKLNINRFLESAKRSDVRGYNIYTCGNDHMIRPDKDHPVVQKWDTPRFGLHGKAAIGHEIDKSNLVVAVLSVNDTTLDFIMTRNRWTPAYMDTYYRCLPFGEYNVSGLIAVREKKCFTENDTFLSHLTIFNDGRLPMDIKVSLSVPFDKIGDGSYCVKAGFVPHSLGTNLTLTGFAAAKTDKGDSLTVTVPAHSNVTLKYGFAFSADNLDNAHKALSEAFDICDPFSDSENRFNEWMDIHAPKLEIDNTDLLKIYYYRFFVIKSAIHTPSEVYHKSVYRNKCVYESPFGTWFGGPIGLPIPLQIQDMKWMKDVSDLKSNISNWCERRGCTQSYIQFTPMAIWNLYLQTGDKTIVTDCYESSKRYTLKKENEGQRNLPITVGSGVVGAEYQPSYYQHAEPKWDWRSDVERRDDGTPFSPPKLYRVDECTMLAANLIACKKMASLLGNSDDYNLFSARLDATLKEMKDAFWDEKKKFFFDRDVKTDKLCDEAYCYDGFTPMMFSIFGNEYHCVFDKLQENGSFDTGFSVSSVDKDCPMYWFDNCITGPTAADLANPHPYDCSWNGPVWPFAVSLILEALGSASYSNAHLTSIFQRLFAEYTELHFDFADRSTPCICEHYRPTDAISFSPYTEYFHSEWLNLFFAYYLGIRITENGFTFHPIFDGEFTVCDVRIQGKKYRFSQERKDGKLSCCVTEQ